MSIIPENDSWHDACAAALAELPGMGPLRLGVLLDDFDPGSAWASLGEGSLPSVLRRTLRQTEKDRELPEAWARNVRRTDPLDVLARYENKQVIVLTRYGRYPDRLVHDEYAPAVLFAKGDISLLKRPTAGIIGTRRCSHAGKSIAERFGREIASAGISVVSGLAAGIDGAAHRGVLTSAFGQPPIGVVGCGLDVPYPVQNTALWHTVASEGLLLSEAPLGASPERWRFPARNRILAAISDVLVVVESHKRGGSLITVDEALARNIPVMAVPGSLLSPSNVGSNALLSEFAPPACSAQDVIDEVARVTLAKQLVLLDEHANDGADACQPRDVANAAGPAGEEEDSDVFAAVDWDATSTDDLLYRTQLSLGELATSLMRLEERGRIAGEGGWWWRCT